MRVDSRLGRGTFPSESVVQVWRVRLSASALTTTALSTPPAANRPSRLGDLALIGTAVGFLSVMLVLPSLAIAADALTGGLAGLGEVFARPDARHALGLTLWTAAVMAALNAVFGTLTAWVLVRCEFPGRALLDKLIDIPFAVPTLITGLMLVNLYGPDSPIGTWLAGNLGVRVAFAPPGIVLALLFVTFPFVVRSVQPVLQELDTAEEEAAETLGASPLQTFLWVVLPALRPAIISGTLLAFARALGEFGSIVMVAGNIPMRSRTAAVWVLTEIESENRRAASAMSLLLMGLSFALIVLVEWQRQRAAGRST